MTGSSSAWRRRLRATAFMTTLWTLAWATVGAVVGALMWLVLGPVLRLPVNGVGDIVALNMLLGTVYGLLGGLGFSLALAIGERGADAASLKYRRAVRWGLIAGSLGPLLSFLRTLQIGVTPPAVQTVVMSLVSLGLASGTALSFLAMARRGTVLSRANHFGSLPESRE